MQSDSPSVEPAPTRRSSRIPAKPVEASSETQGISRAELRRRAQAAVLEAASATPLPAPVATRRSSRIARPAAEQTAPLIDVVEAPAEPFELIEPAPVVDEPIVVEPLRAETVDEPQPAASGVDEFEAAARLFAFTGETPIVADAAPEASAGEPERVAHVAPRRSRGTSFKRIVGASFSIGVMGVVGLLTVGLTTPAEAVALAGGTDVGTSLRVAATAQVDAAADDEIQAYVAPAGVENADISKGESYSTATLAEMAAQAGIKHVSNFFVNDPNAAIQWPFQVGVPITYGFGMRSGTMHQGVDFVPGAGSPIQAIADGTVRVATNSGGGYGVHVIIDHVIDGQLVSSHYAHMISGSIQVTEGQHVTVGTVLGKTGNTGRSFGAHTHFEILLNGTTPIDPIPWLRQHAGG